VTRLAQERHMIWSVVVVVTAVSLVLYTWSSS
jgi:hypothetical protein